MKIVEGIGYGIDLILGTGNTSRACTIIWKRFRKTAASADRSLLLIPAWFTITSETGGRPTTPRPVEFIIPPTIPRGTREPELKATPAPTRKYRPAPVTRSWSQRHALCYGP